MKWYVIFLVFDRGNCILELCIYPVCSKMQCQNPFRLFIFRYFLFSFYLVYIICSYWIVYCTLQFVFSTLYFSIRPSWYYALFHSLLFEVLTGACELPVYSFLSTFFTSANLRAADFHLKLLFAVISKTLFFCCNVGTSVMVEETPKTFFTVW